MSVMPERVRRTINNVAAEHQVHPADIIGRDRRRKVAVARRAAMQAVRALDWHPSYCNFPRHPSFMLMARWFERDHSTVVSAVKGGKRRAAK